MMRLHIDRVLQVASIEHADATPLGEHVDQVRALALFIEPSSERLHQRSQEPSPHRFVYPTS